MVPRALCHGRQDCMRAALPALRTRTEPLRRAAWAKCNTCSGTRRGRSTRASPPSASPVGVLGSGARWRSSTCSGTLNSHSVATWRGRARPR